MKFHIKSLSYHHYACTMPIYNYCIATTANIFTRKTHEKLEANSQESCVGHVANHAIITIFL